MINYDRSFSSIKGTWNINSSSLTMSILYFSSHGVSKKSKSWTGEGSPTRESPLPSKPESGQSKKYRPHSTVSTPCPIIISCARWDSKNGSDATIPTGTTEKSITTEAHRTAWQTWGTKIITHVSENGTRPHMLAQIISWGSWWNCPMPKRLKTSGKETWATVKCVCSPLSTTHQMTPRE